MCQLKLSTQRSIEITVNFSLAAMVNLRQINELQLMVEDGVCCNIFSLIN